MVEMQATGEDWYKGIMFAISPTLAPISFLRVESPSGEVWTWSVSPETTVADIVDLASEKEGIPAHHLELVCDGRVLESELQVTPVLSCGSY